MKYIRTKGGKVKKSKDFTADELWNYENESDNILKQADTIEELCDERVIIDANGNHIVVKTELEEIWWKQYDKDFVKCYGAIWTDNGLIYVAKMNEKGELELL